MLGTAAIWALNVYWEQVGHNLSYLLTFRGPCIVIYSYNKSQQDALFLKIYFDKELYTFQTDLLSVIRSLNTVYTAIGICHAEILKVGKITSVT